MRHIEGLRLKRLKGIQTLLEQSLAVVNADDKIQFERHGGMRFGNFWTPSVKWVNSKSSTDAPGAVHPPQSATEDAIFFEYDRIHSTNG